MAHVLLLSIGMFLVSCEGSKKEGSETMTGTEMHEEHKDHDSGSATHDHSEDMATAVYQCPMKCEGEKTYAEPGTCPECNMKLAKIQAPEEGADEE